MMSNIIGYLRLKTYGEDALDDKVMVLFERNAISFSESYRKLF